MCGTDGEAGVEDRASLVRATQQNSTKRETWKWDLSGGGDEERREE